MVGSLKSCRVIVALGFSVLLAWPALAGLRWDRVSAPPGDGKVQAIAVGSYFGSGLGSGWASYGVAAVPGHWGFQFGSQSPLCPECCADAQSVEVVGVMTYLVGTSCGAFVESFLGSGPAGPGLPFGAAVTAMTEEPVYVGTSNAGVFRFTPGGSRGYAPGLFAADSAGLPGGASVRMLGRGASGTFVSLAGGDLYEKVDSSGPWYWASEGLPSGAAVTAVGGLSTDFAAVSGAGLYRRGSDATWVMTPIPVKEVSALRSAAGQLFAATGTTGVLRKAGGVWQREGAGLPPGADARSLASLYLEGRVLLIPSGESLYVGTAGQGVFAAFAPPQTLTLPCVVDTAGSGGLRYRTELVVGNRSGRSGLRLGGGDFGGWGPVTVPRNGEFRTADAVDWLRKQGANLPAGEPAASLNVEFDFPYYSDSPEPLYIFARVYASDRFGGTYGVSLSSVTDLDAAEEEGTVYGLRSESDVDRSNLAVVNVPSGEPTTLSVQVFSADGTPAPVTLTRTLASGEWFQWNDVLKLAGMPEGSSGYARITRIAGGGPWTAYGVVNDAKTSDGALLSLFRSGGAAASRELLVPVVLDVAGEAGSHYTTEVTLANDSAKATSVEMVYRAAPEYGGGGPAAAPARLTLAEGEQRTITNVISYLRTNGVPVPVNGSGDSVGTLLVTFRDLGDGLDANTVVLARTTTPNPNVETGGRFGTAYAAVPWAAGALQSALVPALSQDEQSRSNVAVVNVGGGGSSAPLVLSVQLRDAANGQNTGQPLQVTLAPGEWHQWSRIAQLAGTASTQFTAVVTRVSGDDTFYAYGVVNDAKTSDGSFTEMIRLDGN